MDTDQIKSKIKDVVEQATLLKNKYITETSPVNYVCIFSQNHNEYNELINASKKIGKIIKKTQTGPIFKIKPMQTISGKLQLLKIKLPDKTRNELGDVDFTIIEFYKDFKEKYLKLPQFKLIRKEKYQMVELIDSDFKAHAYFSNPPLDQELGIVKW
jgi:hypothetical protein